MSNVRKLNDGDMGRLVFVYYNLHKHLWSVKDAKSGLVIGHCDRVTLKDVEYKVSEAGRLRVLSSGQKNVHAGCKGTLTQEMDMDLEDAVEISYNPRKGKTFFEVKGKKEVYFDDLVVLANKKAYAIRKGKL